MERSKESFRGGEAFLRQVLVFSLVLLLQRLTIDDFCASTVAADLTYGLSVMLRPGGG
jgi:hypothetical protein